MTVKLCTTLLLLLLGIQNILYSLKDKRGDTEFDGDTQFDVTPERTRTVKAVINAQILEQLDRTGKLLDRIENNDCKKTSDKSKAKNVKIRDAV